MDKLHWSVNSLVIRNGNYFGYGWIFHEEKEIESLGLLVRFDNDKTQSITLALGNSREDVVERYPKFGNALHSGYLFLGCFYYKFEQPASIILSGTLVDCTKFEVDIPQTLIIQLDPKLPTTGLSWIINFLKSGLHRLLNVNFYSLCKKGFNPTSSRNDACLLQVRSFLEDMSLKGKKNLVLVIDHDLGGGANFYREQLIEKKIKEGSTVCIFSFNVSNLSYFLMMRSKELEKRFEISGYDFLLILAEQFGFREIIYNTGVSFTNPEKIPQLIVKLKKLLNPHLTILVHDFFIVCPSHTLIDDKGVFCRIPEKTKCQDCLSRNQQDFVSLFHARDMYQWRNLWGEAIELADEVLTFSNDSLNLLKKAYPLLNMSRAVIKPHEIKHVKFEYVVPTYTSTLRIGVVGNISYHKGAKFVQELARKIKERKLDVQIVVIGTIYGYCEQSIVQQTGAYVHEQLPGLIKKAGINVILFPSIWPETFSYVVHELIELNLPMACFDLGAPAERLASYPKGFILSEKNPSSVLDSLIDIHHKMYLN
jgi:glycosyltransferase involved in cell wall biosynthesis